MWPWGHLGFAYLAFVAYTRLDSGRQQTALTLGALALGSQVPDLIDKPLAWTFAILPSGRSLGHSLLTLVLVGLVCVRVAAWYRSTDVAEAFVFGWLAHLVTDLDPGRLGALLGGDLSQLQWFTYLTWPLLPLPLPEVDGQRSIIEHFATVALDPFGVFQFALLAAAIVVWIREGTPGVDDLRRWLAAARAAA